MKLLITLTFIAGLTMIGCKKSDQRGESSDANSTSSTNTTDMSTAPEASDTLNTARQRTSDTATTSEGSAAGRSTPK